MNKITRLVTIILLNVNLLFAQSNTPPLIKTADTASLIQKTHSLTISAQLRTRTEFRNGYRILPTTDTPAAFFTNFRGRLNLDYKTKNFDFFLSLQETRVWGQQDGRQPTLPLYFFEAYAEPRFSDRLSMRIGRQRIMYDDQRLFAENDWRPTANSHDALRVIYNNNKNLSTEFIAAFNQSGENNFSTSYKPAGFVNYKTLLVHFLNWKLSENFQLMTLNTMDGFQSGARNNYQHTYNRLTNGGRLTFKAKKWTFTFSGYSQHGKDSSGMNLSAFFLQPEFIYAGIKNLNIRLGMEVMSGQDATKPVIKDNNFVPLYGVAHRFNGNMDFFTVFPADLNNAGLINPYLFFRYQKGKWALRMDHHLFYSQNNFVYQGSVTKKYLGYENDWRVNYQPNNYSDIEFGFCWASTSESMTIIKKGGNNQTLPYWTYVSLKFSPTLAKLNY